MRIVVTGSEGFVGKNLRVRLRELGHQDVMGITRASSSAQMRATMAEADFVFHLAGVNRPKEPGEFAAVNAGFTQDVCEALAAAGRCAPLVFASSIQAELDNPYGRSKRAGEEAVLGYGKETGARAHVFRLANVFGKWCRPNYNSAVATFCHNIARGLSITVNDPAAPLRLIHVDDVVKAFTALLSAPGVTSGLAEAGPVYATTVGDLAATVRGFAESRSSLVIPRVGTGLVRALYSTYVSYLPAEAFSYRLPQHADARGVFMEVLKTPDCGQFSYFTAHPGVTRGGHYHHGKTEKFLVIKGSARFGFRQIDTGEMHEVLTRGGEGLVVETVPGWTHDITNVGEDELVVMLWANELFDPQRPDTVPMKVKP